VVLSADGGDELFGGYMSYVTALRQWSQLSRLPVPVRRSLATALRGIGMNHLDDWLAGRRWPGELDALLRNKLTTPLGKISERAAARGVGDIFDAVCRHFRHDELATLTGHAAPTRTTADRYPGVAGERLCLWDLHNYLPGDVLAKVDRATMALSIEGREPLIDHRLVEFAVSIPFGLRHGPLGAKHLLKTVLYRYVPRRLVDRPKRGFAVPIKEWLGTDLQELVREHLNARTLADQGLFDPQLVQRYLARLWAGDKSVQQRAWLLLAFQMWHRRWMASGR
jgi:asparagine synthase (glutamine-hydrolysing)